MKVSALPGDGIAQLGANTSAGTSMTNLAYTGRKIPIVTYINRTLKLSLPYLHPIIPGRQRVCYWLQRQTWVSSMFLFGINDLEWPVDMLAIDIYGRFYHRFPTLCKPGRLSWMGNCVIHSWLSNNRCLKLKIQNKNCVVPDLKYIHTICIYDMYICEKIYINRRSKKWKVNLYSPRSHNRLALYFAKWAPFAKIAMSVLCTDFSLAKSVLTDVSLCTH